MIDWLIWTCVCIVKISCSCNVCGSLIWLLFNNAYCFWSLLCFRIEGLYFSSVYCNNYTELVFRWNVWLYIKAQAFSSQDSFFDLGLTGSGLGFMICHKMSPRIHHNQARIHTGFHRFTEIGQVFHNKHIFNNNSRTFQVEIWKMVCTNVFFFQFPGSRQKPGKGSFRKLKPKKIPGGASGLP